MSYANLQNWVTRPLSELTDKIGSGATPKGGQSAYKENGISLIRSLNVHDLEFRYKDLARIDDAQAMALSNVEVEARDVLLNITGASIARCAQVPVDVLPARVNQHVSILRPKGGLLDSRFLSYLLVSDGTKNRLLNIGDKAGATRQALTKAQLQAFEVPVPPLDEQKQIVAVLDQAFAALDRARAHAEANLADAKDLFVRQRETSLSGDKKRWPAMTVSDVCERFEYGTSTKSLPDGRVPVLRMGNLQHGELDWSSLVYTDDKGDIEKLALHADDVLFNRTNSIEHVGKTAIFRGGHEAIFAGYLIRLHVRKNIINPEYLNIFLNSNAARDYGRTVMGKSVNQANISASKLRTYPIDVPSLAEQETIVENLLCIREQTDRLKDAFETKLSDLANLRQSLLQKAFSGELT